MITRGCSASPFNRACPATGFRNATGSLIIAALHIGVTQRVIDGCEQVLPAEWFHEEAADVLTCRSILVADFVTPGQKKHRQFRPLLLDDVEKFKAVHAG